MRTLAIPVVIVLLVLGVVGLLFVACAAPEPQVIEKAQPTPVARPLRCLDKEANVIVYVDNYGGGIALLSLSSTAKVSGVPVCNFAK